MNETVNLSHDGVWKVVNTVCTSVVQEDGSYGEEECDPEKVNGVA